MISHTVLSFTPPIILIFIVPNLPNFVYKRLSQLPPSMSLSKLKMPKIRPIRDSDLNDEDRDIVSYTSVNDKTHSSFTAVTDPNSRHASRLAKIALSVQQNNDQKNRQHKEKSSSWLPQLGFWQPPQNQNKKQLEYYTAPSSSSSSSSKAVASGLPSLPPPPTSPSAASYASTSYSYPQAQRYSDDPTHVPYQPPVNCCSGSDVRTRSRSPATGAYSEVVEAVDIVDAEPPATTGYYAAYSGGTYEAYPYHPPTSREPNPTITTMAIVPRTVAVTQHHEPVLGRVIPRDSEPYYPAVEVTRYRTEHKTAYEVREKRTSGNGNSVLRVSAPKGSSEAQLFDAIAEANSAQESTVRTFIQLFSWQKTRH